MWLLHDRLFTEATRRFEKSPIGVRAVARRLETSPAQIYRILDRMNTQTSIDQVVRLIIALGGEFDFTVTDRKPYSAPTTQESPSPTP